MLDGSGTVHPSTLTLRKPSSRDGADIWALVRACKPLDENSMYCNLVQCDHFADTCVVAVDSDKGVVGWVSGHMVPSEPGTLFVWQVAVSEKARGRGLGAKMLSHLVNRADLDVRRIKTTITKDNGASWALFRKFAARAGADLTDRPHFTEADHFDGQHATEHMVTITLRESPAASPRAAA
ncbi:diaminobutyrate acetyltransferase [Pseudooceanicola sp. CBS1P-1]|uniref:L-2,4-diaminobutyric acid acetyltransferase n=1 Tax=Pseudooceanicola albus TaxID=2692189 RepID=A0A6L7G529_9RHOB|nr:MULTISPECIES: diaminobutyrate acetyltransferase [Pseudooceanicola]MBT9384779.1 diaminobutyrate acetyltransferase [Pseudooceanicola endophyticus]MXN18480.1 diaminobutyrate acetyltransferase [Pseudooceanicola albus]